ncbi:hypothetical protein HK098_006733 [Nowakowskiella sp. JEL0407]|nr:hypothetical protein HK098_006733 [Nowakowskiella sp. JEL0407]
MFYLRSISSPPSVYNLYNIPTPYDSKKKADAITFRNDVLLILSYRSESGEEIDSEVILYGLLASEFITYNETTPKIPTQFTTYISKLDSTGILQSFPSIKTKSLGSALVLHYVDSVRTSFPTLPIEVHVFARSQPSYLFQNSEKNPGKRVLSDDKLVKYWKKTLGCFGKKDDSQASDAKVESVSGYWLVPGETEVSLPKVAKVPVSGNVTWEYGIRATKGQDLRYSLPLFPDDPLGKALDLITGEVTMLNLVNMLRVVGDCSIGRTGIFSIRFHPLGFGKLLDSGRVVEVKDREFKDIMHAITVDGLYRNDKETAQTSFKVLVDFGRLSGVTPVEFNPNVYEQRLNPTPTLASKSESSIPKPNNIQSFVKRKPAAPNDNTDTSQKKRTKLDVNDKN